MCLKTGREDTSGAASVSGSGQAAVVRKRRVGLVRARIAASVLSVLSGLLAGAFAARAPDVKAAAGASNVAWGWANTLANIGAVAGMAAVLVLISRASTRVLAFAAALVVLIVTPAAAGAASVPVLIVFLVLVSFGATLMSTPMTALTVQVQRGYGRPLLAGFGACWSGGSLTGAGLGIAATAAGISPRLELGCVSAALAAAMLATARWLPKTPRPAAKQVRRRFRDRFTPQLALLAWMRFLTIFIATASSVWAAIYVAGSLHAGSTWGAAVYTGFSVANTLTLMGMNRIMAQFGQIRYFRVSTFFGAAAILAGLLVGTPLAAMAGFVALGVGTACIDPVVYGLGGTQPGLSAGEGISVVELGDMPAGPASAAIIAALAGATDLRLALLSIPLAMLALTGATYRLRPTPQFRTDDISVSA